MKTLLLALISPGKSKGTREGAIRGLMGVGKEAIRKGLVEGGGAKVVGSECAYGETDIVRSVMVRFLLTAKFLAEMEVGRTRSRSFIRHRILLCR